MALRQTMVIADVSQAVKKWKGKRGNLIMILHDIQEHYGCVPRQVSFQLAKQTGIPLGRIYEVLTFYNYFKIEPPGKYVVSVCTGTACHLKGADKLVEDFKAELKIKEGETTDDGKFHLQTVRCVGCCGLAPVAMVNGQAHGRLKPGDAPKVIEKTLQTPDRPVTPVRVEGQP